MLKRYVGCDCPCYTPASTKHILVFSGCRVKSLQQRSVYLAWKVLGRGQFHVQSDAQYNIQPIPLHTQQVFAALLQPCLSNMHQAEALLIFDMLTCRAMQRLLAVLVCALPLLALVPPTW